LLTVAADGYVAQLVYHLDHDCILAQNNIIRVRKVINL